MFFQKCLTSVIVTVYEKYPQFAVKIYLCKLLSGFLQDCSKRIV